MAHGQDPLDVFIDSLPDHRQYHPGLASVLDNLLSSKQKASSSNQITPSVLPGNNYATTRAAVFGKQVKRLVNQSMVTLTQWCKVLNAPDSSDTVARQRPLHPNSTIAASTSIATATAATACMKSTGTGGRRLNQITKAALAAGSTTWKTTSGAARSDAMKADMAVNQTLIAGSTYRSGTGVDTAGGGTNTNKTWPSKATRSTPTVASEPAGQEQSWQSLYNTDQPTYSHVAVLVDISFLSLRTLELMESKVSTGLFEIEKARSNLISKIVALGMKKRALQELGILREQLIAGAMAAWNEPGLMTRTTRPQHASGSNSCLFPTPPSSSSESLRKTYQHLFSFPFSKRLVSDLERHSSTPAPVSTPPGSVDPAQTFVLLVQALHNNAVRCWMDVRNGSLAHLLYPMLTQQDSPYDWCVCTAKTQPRLAQQSLDALFRLLFMAAGKAVENNPSREGHRHAFLLRMLGMRYHAASKHYAGSRDGSVWDRVMRCGAEYEKSTREGQTQEDIVVLVAAYKEIFEVVQELSPIDYTSSHYQVWYKHLVHFAPKVDDLAIHAFVRSIDSRIQDTNMPDATPDRSTESLTLAGQSSRQQTAPVKGSEPATDALDSPPKVQIHSMPVDQVLCCLEEAVKSLRKFQDLVPVWQSESQPRSDLELLLCDTKASLLSLQSALSAFPTKNLTAATLQNIARIFRSMDKLRSVGAKILDKIEQVESVGGTRHALVSSSGAAVASGPTIKDLPLLGSIQTVLQSLSDLTETLWSLAGTCYQERFESDQTSLPAPAKLSCARVDAILFLSRLYLSNLSLPLAQPMSKPVTTYLESALWMARRMGDQESLPWISNAFYNYGGSLFKSRQQKEAIRPLELAIQSYRFFLGDDVEEGAGHDKSAVVNRGTALDLVGDKSTVDGRLILANRYEVLGVCFQSLNRLDEALASFNSGLCNLPLEAFQQIDHVALGDMKTSPLPAAKLLNRRARTLLMMPQPQFVSVLTSVPEFEARLSRQGVPPLLGGIVQEYESGLLSVLGVKANQVRLRNVEQIEIMKHLVTKVYRGGRSLTHPVRRARALVRLAVLYQGQVDLRLHTKALQLVEEAIEILKEQDLKSDGDLEPVRNHHLAMAYTWQGVLERDRDEVGLARKSKPFQIALQLWEVILSGVDCFVSWEDSYSTTRPRQQGEVEGVRSKLPDPEQLYGHLQMLADCLGMIDYRVLQVQIYLLMLRLSNGVLPISEETCADAVRIYSRMGQAYLALGYSGKARSALEHGQAILEEMSSHSDGLTMQGEVYPIWLLAHSLYLTSVGLKSQGVTAYNKAKYYSQIYMDQAISKPASATRHSSSIGAISRSVDAKVQRAMIVVEASLARSQLLFFEGNLPESITDAMRALRQLNRIISTLATAIEASQQDSTVICQRPMDNPFLVRDEPTDRNNPMAKSTTESHQRRQGIELLATQRYQWSIFRLLSEAYHQLSRLYLAQGSLQETEYFVKEGQHTARLSKAGNSLGRFMLDQAHVGLLKHEWEESQQILDDLSMEDSNGDGALDTVDIQDARIQLLSGDLNFATERFDLSLRAYYRTDEVLAHLMDKSVILKLEELVVREPQTPREKRLVTLYRYQGEDQQSSAKKLAGMASDRGSPGTAQLECVLLSEIKAAMGYRTSLLINRIGKRAEAKELVEDSKAEDSMGLTSAEYYLTKAKMLMTELEDAMAKHLMYAMIPDSALSIGLFQKPRAQSLAPFSDVFGQGFGQSDIRVSSTLDSYHDSPSSSPSVRATRMSHHRRSQPVSQQPMAWSPLSSGDYLAHAFRTSFHTCPAHVVSDICARLTYLSFLESCFHAETLNDGLPSEDHLTGEGADRRTNMWRMASQAACSLEMAKAVTQRREMHGLVKQKLHPTLPQEDQSWPRDIASKDDQHLPSPEFKISQEPEVPEVKRHGHKTVTLVGLEKPRPLKLVMATATDHDMAGSGGDDMELKDVTMSRDGHPTRQAQQEYLSRELLLHPSSTLGNKRSFLEELDRIYEQDAKMISATEDRSRTFQRDFVDILPENWTVVSLTMDVERGVLYVNRLRARTIPLVVRLPLSRAQLREGDGELGLNMAPMGFGDEEGEEEDGSRADPLSYAGAVEELQDIMKESQETLSIASSVISGHVPATGHCSTPSASSAPLRPPVELSKEAKAEWWNRRQNLNDRLRMLLSSMEDQWLCGLKGLIQSHNTPVNDENLLGFKRTLECIMSQAGSTVSSTPVRIARSGMRGRTDPIRDATAQVEISLDLCRVILNLGDRPTYSELRDLIYFLLDAYLFKNVSTSGPSSVSSTGSPWSTASPFLEYTEEQFNRIAMQIREALRCYWEAEVAAENNGYDDGAHIILILDKHLQMFPWESCPVLRDEAVSRVPSIWFLRDRILQQRYLYAQEPCQDALDRRTTPTFEGGPQTGQQEWRDLEVDGQKTFYLLNPGGDLKNTEEKFKDYVQSQPGWTGIIGRTPLDLECIQGLSKNELYIYFGHSGGEQYVSATQIRKLGHCAVSILLGCSSGLLRSSGEFDPTGNVMNYLLAGCPTVVANLWDVTDRDLDRFSKALFTLWGLDDISGDDGEATLRSRSVNPAWSDESMEGLQMEMEMNDTTEMGTRTRLRLRRPRLSIVEAVKEAREECRLKYLVGAATVVYGIPCFLKTRT
ncbi:hypothetical protein BGX29_000419 [Mortierella sp. GBA35]|nr:hypothetical protein BGX29_000419 [Mortierella sp. GBA35]